MTAKELITYLSKMDPAAQIVVAFKSSKDWDGVVVSAITSACMNGDTVQLNEESFSEALSSMPYWFIVGILGNSGFKSLNMLWRRKRGERLTAKGTPDEMSGQTPETPDAPDVPVSERDLETEI